MLLIGARCLCQENNSTKASKEACSGTRWLLWHYHPAVTTEKKNKKIVVVRYFFQKFWCWELDRKGSVLLLLNSVQEGCTLLRLLTYHGWSLQKPVLAGQPTEEYCSEWHRDVVFHVAAVDARMFSPKALTSLRSSKVFTKAESPIVLHKFITWHTVTFTAVVKESTGYSGIWLWGKSLRHSCRTVWIHLLILWHLINISTAF